MVLWEIALGTAYFLGLKRSYKLALKIQRRIISRNQPRLQQFVQRIVYSVILLFLHAFYSIEFLPRFIRGNQPCLATYSKLIRNFNFVILLFLHVFIRSHSRPFYTGASALLLRRTRVVFDIALKVHRNIQHRDLEVGRNLGDCILRWLHKIKPSAQIRGPPPHQEPNHGTGKANMNMPKQVTNTSSPKTPRSNQSPRNHDAGRHLFSSLTRTWPKSFPTTIAMMMQPPTATGNMTRCRHLSINGPDASRLNYTRDQGVVRKDIMQWMVRK